MNPVLLKPESDTGSQVIVQGQRRGTLRSLGFGSRRDELFPLVLDSFERLLGRGGSSSSSKGMQPGRNQPPRWGYCQYGLRGWPPMCR